MIEAVLSAAYPAGEPLTVGTLRYCDVRIMDHFRPVIPTAVVNGGDHRYSLDDAFVKYPGGSRLRIKASAVPLALIALILGGGGYLAYVLAYAPVPASEDQIWALLLGILAAASFTMRFLRVTKRLHLSYVRTNTFELAPEASDYQRERNRDTMERLGIKDPEDFDIGFETTFLAASRINKACRINSEVREGLKVVTSGQVRHVHGSDWAMAYNPAHIAFTRLNRQSNWRTIVGLAFILIIVATVFLAVALITALWGDALGAVWYWFIVVPTILALAMFCFGVVLSIVFAGARLLAGMPFSEVYDIRVSNPYTVQVRALRGRWATIAHFRHQAVAVEVYNLIVRDLRKPAE